ncbi:thioesterase family protein [Acidilobus sp. 7A]|uniref:acyl-CoA thioesterase n=1 Tax=Acidilobus sp. 7A TaxID=1577685 RepID=UPI000764D2AD|nr:thioesterase family protein [Acidilobus sp. 7A]AMD30413.1 thioesterase [Acidilobus sp. 7A]
MAPGRIFSATYRVYWSETDAACMMHFSNYFRVCERTEEEFLTRLGFSQRAEPGKRIIMPRVSASCDYKSPLGPGHSYRVDIVDIVIGRSSITYVYEIFNETTQRLSAACTIVAVAYDEASGRSVEVPVELKEKLLAAGARLRDERATG